MDLVTAVYEMTSGTPAHELYGLTNQIRRSAVSVPSNIAEGHTREHTKEYLNHLSMAHGSLAELQTQLELAGRLNYAPKESVRELLDRSASIARQLYSLRNALLREEDGTYVVDPNPRPLSSDPEGGAY